MAQEVALGRGPVLVIEEIIHMKSLGTCFMLHEEYTKA